MRAQRLRPSRACVVLVSVVLACVVVSCSGSDDIAAPPIGDLPGDKPVVDYTNWPLARAERAITAPACTGGAPDKVLFDQVTPDQAGDGWGISDAWLAHSATTEEPCPFEVDEELSSAFGTAVARFLDTRAAKSAYGKYEDCLSSLGVDGASDPQEAQKLVTKHNGDVLESEETSPGAGVLSGALDKHRDEMIDFERRVSVASARCQAEALAPVAAELIAAQKSVIDSAPAAIRKLLLGA